jgi:hypothetical protein
MGEIGTRKTETDVELPLFLVAAAAADWDAVLAMKCVELYVLALKTAWGHREFDQMRELPLVHAPGGLSLPATHLLQSSSASRFTAGASGFFILSQSGERPER